MSFPRYLKYKDSGVEWLGEVPAHWVLPPLYLRYEVVLGKMLDTKRLTGERPLPYLRNVDVQWDQVNVDALPELDIAPDEHERFTLRTGDLLVCEGGEVGRTAIWRGELEQCAFQKAVHRLRPLASTEDPRFLYHCMRFAAATSIFIADGNPNTIPHLTGEKFRLYRFPKPPVAEQTQIAAFLDRETAKIDELVAEQRRLMELLKEKRQAVISHAVTQGLNPDAPMKPSGIEWLGDVPAHWEVVSLKRFCDVRDGTHDTPQFIDASDVSFPFVTSKDLVNGQVCLDETKHVSATDYHEISRRSGVARGDVLMPMIGSIGGAVLVETDVHFAIKNIALFKASTNYNSRWLQLMLDSDLSVLQFELNRSGGVQGFVALGTLRNLSFPFPSLDEQDKIVSFLAIESAKFDTLTAEAQRAIDLLQERRTALISAAVTGQIDVRGICA